MKGIQRQFTKAYMKDNVTTINMLQLELIYKKVVELKVNQLTGVRDIDRLNSIMLQQNQHIYNVDLYPTVFDKAGMLWKMLISSHAFIDGNKRIAFLVALMTLRMNNIYLDIDVGMLYNFSISIIVNHLTIDEVSAFLKDNSVSIGNARIEFDVELKEVFNDLKVRELLDLLSR